MKATSYSGASHQLGLAVSYDSVDQVAEITQKYRQWCQTAGWQPTPDQIVYHASILLAETDQQAANRVEGLKASGLGERGMNLRPSVTQAVLAAREGRKFDLHNRDAGVGGAARGQGVRAGRELITFEGGPDTIVKQLRAFHDKCGTGVVDLGFQLSGMDHKEVMKEIGLFGREVLPRIKEF